MRTVIALCIMWGLAFCCAAQQADVFARHVPLVTKSLLLGACRAGHRVVTVGEFGDVLLSDDDGRSWRQAKSVPTRTTLTAVTFVDESRGWMVGHGGQILATSDGGETWRLQYGTIDGTDSLFSVWFENTSHGIAVGPYGYALSTRDGGDTWTRFYVAEGDDGERHLNDIFRDRNGRLFIAAELGAVFLSDDNGTSWRMVELPYGGSIWGGEERRDGSIVLFGMAGHALVSTDHGDTWSEIVTGTEQSLTDAVELDDGRFAMVGLGGAMSVADAAGNFKALVREDRITVTCVVQSPSGLLLFTQRGVLNYPLPPVR